MSETNPYEAPQSDLLPPSSEVVKAKGALSDKALAARMLQLHERGGYPLGLYLRWNAARYLLKAVIYAGLFALCESANLRPLFLVLLGVFIGSVVRDFEWLRATQKTWPFNAKVINWEKVRALADGVGSSL